MAQDVMERVYIGIDTSNYRTSTAAADGSGEILTQQAVLLDVPEGSRGLRQSEAFFRHSNRLPDQLDDLFGKIDPSKVAAIGVSERPRRVEGSYMPCFMAGVNAAREIASALKVPVYRFSHQEGHAAAVMESCGKTAPRECIFFHMSGGTTEALLCRPDANGYAMEIVGGTRDISAGQLLDRFGVAMGLPFPSGSFLDDTAYELLSRADFDCRALRKTGVLPKLKIDDGYFNLSGAETRLMRFSESEGGDAAAEVITELFSAVSGLLIDDALYLSGKYGIKDICMAGGVASSRTLRAIAKARGCSDIRFGAVELSGDNAAGTALLAKRIHETRNSNPGK